MLLCLTMISNVPLLRCFVKAPDAFSALTPLSHPTTLHVFSSSIGTTAHCGLWPVKQSPSIYSYLSPSLSIFSFLALEDLFLLPLSILSWVFPCVLSLPDFNTVCTFHVARFISVYLVLSFCPSTINPSSCFLCSTFVTIIFFTVWGC
jgi:hypothetical protein